MTSLNFKMSQVYSCRQESSIYKQYVYMYSSRLNDSELVPDLVKTLRRMPQNIALGC